MILFSYGITKSGSTLAFELAKAILSTAGYEQTRLSDDVVEPGHHINFVNGISRQRIDRLLRAVPEDQFIAIKTHSGFPPLLLPYLDELSRASKIRIHANFRDPREICLSLMDAGVQARQRKRQAFSEIETLDQAVENVSRQINVFMRWACVRGVLRLAYNRTAFEMDAAIDDIAAHLGVTPDRDEVRRIVNEVAFTQKNKAVKNRYKSELTPEQDQKLQAEFRLFLNNLCRQQNPDFLARRRAALLARANELTNANG